MWWVRSVRRYLLSHSDCLIEFFVDKLLKKYIYFMHIHTNTSIYSYIYSILLLEKEKDRQIEHRIRIVRINTATIIIYNLCRLTLLLFGYKSEARGGHVRLEYPPFVTFVSISFSRPQTKQYTRNRPISTHTRIKSYSHIYKIQIEVSYQR